MRCRTVCLWARSLRGGRASRRTRLPIRFDREVSAETIAIVSKFLGKERLGWKALPLKGANGHSRPYLRSVFVSAAMLFAICCGFSASADPCPLFITASAVGSYNSYYFGGFYSPQYYGVGAAGSYQIYETRNFFVFDIPPLTQSVVSAELWINRVDNRLDDDSELYELNEVTNSAQTVMQEGVSQPDVFADLGDGALFGSHVFQRLDRSDVVVIPLNEAFISSLTAATGGPLVIGGKVPTLNDNPTDNEILFWTSYGTNTVHLAITLGQGSGPLQILQQPISGSFLDGQEMTLRALVCGGEPISYQWQRDGVDVANASSATLDFQPLRVSQSGDYTLIASNSYGAVTSSVATVSVTAFRASPGPYQAYVLEGSTFQLFFDVESARPFALQWFHDGVPVPQENSSPLIVPSAKMSDSGSYFAIATNIAGSVTSLVANVYVYQQVPYFFNSILPSQSVAEGATATFYAPANGGPSPHYYWFFNGAPISTGDSPELTLVNVTTNDAGFYSVLASNSVGTVSNRASLAVLKAGPLDHWHLRNPLPQPNDLVDLTYANGLFVAVGIHGAILTSTNGQDWALQQSRTIEDLNSVAFGNNRFVAVGNRVILTSTNGQDWRNLFPGLTDLQEVTYGNGVFVAVAQYGLAFLISSNAVDWQPVVAGPFNGYSVALNCIGFGGGQFVAGGYAGQTVAGTSTNGIDWTFQNLGTYIQPEAVRYAGGRFVLVGAEGALFTSNDGSQWIKRNAGATLRLLDVDYGNGAYVAVGVRGTMFRSTDLLHWSAVNSGTPDRLSTVLFMQNKFFVMGESGTTLTSSDGVTWLKQGSGTHLDLDGITTGDNGLVMAVGKDGTVVTTSNGTDIFIGNAGTSNELHGVTFATWREPVVNLPGPPSFRTVKRYVAVGENGTIVSSEDGITWARRNSPTNWSLKAVTYGKSLFVAVGAGGTVVTSSDGVTWKLEPRGIYGPDLNDVTFGNGLFVGVMDQWSSSGTLISSDGHQWTLGGPIVPVNMRGVTFANGTFLIVGNDGRAYSSMTGSNWDYITTGIVKDGDNLRGVSYANGLWTIVGNNGIILTSTNLYNPLYNPWSRRFSPVNVNLHGVRYLKNGTLVAIGNAGTVLNSDRFAPLLEGARGSGGYLVTIHPGVGDTLRLQKSSTLFGWTDLMTFTNSAGPISFLDRTVTNQAGFYRVVSP